VGISFQIATAEARTVMKQFDLMWANLPSPIGRRPVLLLTRSAGYAYLNKVLIAEVTSTIRNIPQEVSLGKSEGLLAPSVVNLDNIHVIPKAALDQRVGKVATHRHREIKRALGYALDWAELKVL
jgi:mRNA interferase MazF